MIGKTISHYPIVDKASQEGMNVSVVSDDFESPGR
jgi:hypothetical protein